MMFELSQIRCFVAVAEELHFGRAAARLNMTQPPLSRQIQILEHALGAKLLDRTNRHVALTGPGQTFLPEAIRLLRLASGAAAIVRRAAAGDAGEVTLGFTTTASYDFLPRALRRLGAAAADIRVTLREATTTALIEALSSGELDLALVRPTSRLAALSSKIVHREPLLLAVSREHRLARVESVTIDDLRGKKIVGYSPDGMKYFHDLVMRLLSLQNLDIEIVQQVAQVHSVLALARAGLGIAIVPASARHLRFDGVEFKNFAAAQHLQAELTLAWRTENPNAATERAKQVLLAMDDRATGA